MIKYNNVENKIITLIDDCLNCSVEKVKPESKLEGDLGADSLDLIELIMSLEEQFNCIIPDQDTETIKTVKDIFDYMKSRKLT